MKMKKTMPGRVFEDLGFDPKEAANLRIRTILMVEIEQYVRKNRLTQKEAARRLGVTQPRLSNILRGKIEEFSIDALVTMLASAGLNVDIRIKPSAAA